MSATPLLTVAELYAWYGPVHALRGVALAVHPGECVAIIGPNGAGKTTLLHALMGLVHARGRVELGGRPVLGLPPEALVARGMVLVPERRQLFTTLSVRDNLLLGAYHRAWREPAAAIVEDLERVLRLFPVLRDRQRAPARALSGGMQQMVAVGRGLMARPRLLLMDEPLLGLAPLVIREILRVLRTLVGQGLALLLVEQNARAALAVAHRAYVMEGGRVVLEGPAAALAEDPRVQAAYLGGHVA
jgi:branched-chain amino acid transport system ATP-binding protein